MEDDEVTYIYIRCWCKPQHVTFPAATRKSVWTFGGLSWPHFVSGANYSRQGDCHLTRRGP